MRRYCITGVCGYIGGLLARRLAREADARVSGIDVKRRLDLDGIAVHERDVRNPGIGDILAAERPDTVIHLAFYTHPEGDAGEAQSVNIDGTRNIVRAAASAGVLRFVLASSAAVYGSHPDNPVPITERHPPRPNEFFYYSRHKAEQENTVREVLRDRPEVELVILRPAAVIGPHIDNPTGAALRAPVLFGPRGTPPPIQLLDEDDAVEAFYRAATGRATGTYNVAAGGALAYPDVARLMNKNIVLLPYPLLAASATLGKWLGLSPVGAKTVRFIRHPLVVDATEFLKWFNFKPRFDTRSALMRFARSL